MTGISKVMIIGGGFAGLEAAKGLTGAAVEITLLDKQNHHCFQPLLYQVATAALSPAEIAWPIREILRDQRNTQVLLAEVEAIDRVARTVHVGETRYAYDYLVVATGATHSYFGHDEWARIAPGLKRIEDATRIRRNILLAFEKGRGDGRSGRETALCHLHDRRRGRDRNRNGRRNFRILVPFTRGPSAAAVQFEVEPESLNQLDQFSASCKQR